MDRRGRNVLGVPQIPGDEERFGAARRRGRHRAVRGRVHFLAAGRARLGREIQPAAGQGGAEMPVRGLQERQGAPGGHPLVSHYVADSFESFSPVVPAIALRFTLILTVSAILSQTIWSSTCAIVP